MINKKHKKIVDNYTQQKSKHLDRLATKTLANEEKEFTCNTTKTNKR